MFSLRSSYLAFELKCRLKFSLLINSVESYFSIQRILIKILTIGAIVYLQINFFAFVFLFFGFHFYLVLVLIYIFFLGVVRRRGTNFQHNHFLYDFVYYFLFLP